MSLIYFVSPAGGVFKIVYGQRVQSTDSVFSFPFVRILLEIWLCELFNDVYSSADELI